MHPKRLNAPPDLGVQLGIGIGLAAPDADLHDAVHILPDEVILVHELDGLARSLSTLPLEGTKQHPPKVRHVVLVHRLTAAQCSVVGWGVGVGIDKYLAIRYITIHILLFNTSRYHYGITILT